MKSTFFRVFLVVLLSNIVVVAIGFSFVYWIEQSDRISDEHLAEIGVELVHSYEEEGADSLNAKVRQVESELNGRIYLYEENGRPLLRPLPRDFREPPEDSLPNRGWSDEQGREPPDRPGRPLADFAKSQFVQVIGSNNAQYLLIYRSHLEPPPLAPAVILGFSLLGLLVSSAILSYWLLSPLLGLQRTIRSLGFGETDARVEGSLLKRHDMIGNLAREFNDMAERVDSLLSSKERLMRDVSHELRTPLARIEVALTIAEDKHGQEVQQNYLDRIRRELHELDELIGQVLTLSRLEASSLKKESIAFQSWLDEIIDDVSFESQLKGIVIKKEGDYPAELVGDSLQLRHALENVLRNACFYSGDNGSVRVATEVESGFVVISIVDSGPGVPDEMLEKIFHAFFRSSSARESNTGGYGVGLTIAKRIVQAHGGTISAHNSESSGLVVVFRLPLT
ncbi:two-component sensor histidine kinase [Marinomonas mediterranea]|jgi:Signal transduction histidine kinase|uniref:histidine kinase n=1 Tax=Marinomonas mediterranea (strain ATCC 700492 / JCM 21426 / NBRC 103028 / MMB-1) TaxID=717774 RepID=F2JWK0_MARM1|nr:HAMP domain-containing sensor histidine kinase [Marinomonas mediterranea]ADZ91764.1 integral membrane sensor signal transduction histidine kinase [Marinomonas mediterranea MMB-1]WCN13802.1 two-component sensor histidine kinase [Marinomonas mediterranea]WCN17858.1 two-component sensor histidine kinase [Marinomonas mediterranea MMB-1]